MLTEAHAVGVVGRGALATPIRRMLAGDSDDAVIAAMDKVLPAPIDHFLLQADLTVVVPGPLERALAEQLAAVATVESAGAAMVYRINEAVRPARPRHRPDRGRTARVVRPSLENPCAAGVDLPDRRRGAAARTAPGRHGGIVRAM